MSRHGNRSGVTLVELIVVLAILGVSAGVVSLSYLQRVTTADSVASRISAARDSALTSGRRVLLTAETDSGIVLIAATPDGAVLHERVGGHAR